MTRSPCFPYLVDHEPDAEALAREIATNADGAVCTFVGRARSHAGGREVLSLHYEAYAEMAATSIEQVLRDAERRFPGARVLAQHRVGPCPLGEASVAVAVASAHRGEAFGACRFVIDEIKQRTPIWKQEHYRDGTHWVGEDGGSPPPSGASAKDRDDVGGAQDCGGERSPA